MRIGGTTAPLQRRIAAGVLTLTVSVVLAPTSARAQTPVRFDSTSRARAGEVSADVDLAPEPKPEPKPALKPTPRPEPKPEIKAIPKAEPTTKLKPIPKPESRPKPARTDTLPRLRHERDVRHVFAPTVRRARSSTREPLVKKKPPRAGVGVTGASGS